MRTAASITALSRRQAHTASQRVERHHVGRVFCLVSKGGYVAMRSLGDVVIVERLELGPPGFAIRPSKLCPLREPRGSKGRQTANDRAPEGGERRDIGWVQVTLRD
jgi:hypothetical protein